jgi:branched-chain amino acid transport system ATP-binding protein
LAPVLVEELLRTLRTIVRDEGVCAIVVEQHAEKVLAITDDALVLERGRVAHRAASAALLADQATLHRYLTVSA